MQTLNEAHKQDASYWGGRPDWLIVDAMTRDSEAISRSNFRVALKRLEAISEEHVAVERSNHWAVGWVDYLIVDRENPAMVAAAKAIQAKLADYPVLDEEDFSREESDEADEVWRNCYSPKERIDYIRKHESQFEFHGLSDLLGCVRGKYFSGYACELLH